MSFYCNICRKTISEAEYRYSIKNFSRALCRYHQNNQKNKSTSHAKRLYNALKKLGIKCQLEVEDGYKSIDISIPWAGLDIEVDGKHHILNPNQLFSDIQRTHYSKEDGFETIRISNSMIEENLYGVAKSIATVARKRYYGYDNDNYFYDEDDYYYYDDYY